MTRLPAGHPPRLCLEFGEGTFRALAGEDGLEVPLERLENGRLSSGSCDEVIHQLRQFLQGRRAVEGRRVLCAVNSRGVTTRKLTLPAAPPEDVEKIVRLQMERELPIAPEELAWGFSPLPQSPDCSVAEGATMTQIMVYAVKKEVVQDYAELLSRCGLQPFFTLNAAALAAIVPEPGGPHSVLEVGADSSELVACVQGIPSSIRVLSWGAHAMGAGLAAPRDCAGATTTSPATEHVLLSSANADKAGAVLGANDDRMTELTRLLPRALIGQKLHVTGSVPQLVDFALNLSRQLGDGTVCEAVPIPAGPGRSPVTLGLQALAAEGGFLRLRIPEPAPNARNPALATPWKWAALALVLATVAIGLRYAEALLQTPRLTRRIADLKAYQQQMPQMERELAFLQYLRTNQPPHLDTVATLADAAPPGLRVDSLSLTRRGDLSLKATLRDSQQLVEFRSRLVRSGHFTSIVLDEQTPSADQQRLTVHMTAQWQRAGDSSAAVTEPRGREPDVPPPAAKRQGAFSGPNVTPTPATNGRVQPPAADGK